MKRAIPKEAKLKFYDSKTFLATSILAKIRVNLLNYRFSKLGDYVGSKQIPYRSNKEIAISKSLMFEFEPINIYTCKKISKTTGPL